VLREFHCDALGVHLFPKYEEVKDAMHTWLRSQPKAFMADGIRNFVYQRNKCVKKVEVFTPKNDGAFVLL
jgi:hypothetical protein